MKSSNPLNELINKYNILKIKYDLLEFSKLNELFDIEEINPETELLLKKIRENIEEKISEYTRFIEVILNPSNATIFFFKILKKLDSSDREILSKIYEKLSKFELKIISLDLKYKEESEAEFIKESYNLFNNEMKKELLEIINKLDIGEENSTSFNGSYLGWFFIKY